ncbi:MAG: phosphate ABC transporter substrate-binding protein [Deltaproteobacteria bacterium]|nr:MAG: phosphate ABC transporter substrate-binding protein [Deltaproteobacteria bacterium]
MKKTVVLSGLVSFLIFCWAGFSLAGDLDVFKGLSGSLHIAGGTAHIKCEREAAKRIMKAYPEVNITIGGGGSGVGIKQVSEGLIDIGNTGRAPTSGEINRCDLKVFKFAIDGIGVIVNPERKITNISLDQVIAVFSGQITNWKELGGPDVPINVYTRDAESGTRKVFWKKALKKNQITKKAYFVRSNAAMKTAIGNDPFGIGYISLGVADRSVKLLALDSVFPSRENVRAGKYKIARGLYMNTKGTPKPLAKAFISYMLSPEGQRLVEKHGFLPVK